MRSPASASALQRVRRRRLDRVGDGDDAGGLAVDRDEDRGGAVLAQPFRLLIQRIGGDAELRQEFGVADRHAPALDHADRALAGRRVEAEHRDELDATLSRGCDDRLRQGVFARPFDAGGKAQDFVVHEAVRRNDGDDLRPSFGQRAGLVDHQRVDLLHPFERLGVADQHAGLRAAADAHHDRHRRREAERARAGDDQHADRGDERVGKARLRSERRPGDKGERRHRDDRRHEPARHLVGQPLDRRARALGRAHHLYDLRDQRVAADLAGAHHERAATG